MFNQLHPSCADEVWECSSSIGAVSTPPPQPTLKWEIYENVPGRGTALGCRPICVYLNARTTPSSPSGPVGRASGGVTVVPSRVG